MRVKRYGGFKMRVMFHHFSLFYTENQKDVIMCSRQYEKSLAKYSQSNSLTLETGNLLLTTYRETLDQYSLCSNTGMSILNE